MKKSSIIILIIIGIILVAGISSITTYLILNSNNDVQSTTEENSPTASNSNNSVNDTLNNDSSNTTQTKKYAPATVIGCTITSFDSYTGECTYIKKCESCGYTASTTSEVDLSEGYLDSSFRCPHCWSNQELRIALSISYE